MTTDLHEVGGGKQQGTDLPAIPDGPRNDAGTPTGNPSGGPVEDLFTFEGYPVSPAVARSRLGAPAAQGHGGNK
jgi:hypothetical protein